MYRVVRVSVVEQGEAVLPRGFVLDVQVEVVY